MKNRVLVTGASGFLGRFVFENLSADGHEIIAAGRCRPAASFGATWLECDLLKEPQRRSLMRTVRPTHMVHLAWYAEHGLFWEAAENKKWLEATADLARLFGEFGGRRFVGAGSCAEYDWTELKGPCLERQTPLRPATLYGRCKDQARAAVASAAKKSGFSQAWARIFHLYGPFEPPRRFVPSIITALLEGREARMSHGEQIRDMLHVADVGAAFAAVLKSDIEGPVNLGSGHGRPLKETARIIAQRLGRMDLLRLGALPAAPNDPPLLVPDISQLNRTGFLPRFDLETGLDQAINWWRDNRRSPAANRQGGPTLLL